LQVELIGLLRESGPVPWGRSERSERSEGGSSVATWAREAHGHKPLRPAASAKRLKEPWSKY
jgi:hypothetical protein